VTVLRAGVFPRWTAWTCLTVAGCALLLLRFPSSRTAGTIGNIAGIALCLVYVAFGTRLGRRTRRA